MKINIEINCDNAAFESDFGETEIVRILRHAANKIEKGDENFRLFDINGNKVGDVKTIE